jgi:hypothetical protein
VTLGSVLSLTQGATPLRAGPLLGGDGRSTAGERHGAAPNVARMCDYYLGGKDNYAADRDLAERVLRQAPIISRLVQINRTFLGNAARFLAGQAHIRQFLDIGCGLPTRDDLCDIVRRVDPACRVAYVDNDPMVLVHARALLAANAGTHAVEADLREPGTIFGHPDVRQLIDFDEPVAVLLLSVLDFVADAENPYGIVDDLLMSLAPGSHVVISHAERTPELEAVSWLYREAGVTFTPRSRQEIAELSRGLELISPYPADLSLRHSGHRLRAGSRMPLIGCIGRTVE